MILKRKKIKAFTVVDNLIILSSSLSPEAKIVLIYLLSKPEGWKAKVADIVTYINLGREEQKRRKLGPSTVTRIMKELVASGHAQKKLVRGEGGKLEGSYYDISDEPIFTETRPRPSSVTHQTRLLTELGQSEGIYNKESTNSTYKENKEEESPPPSSSPFKEVEAIGDFPIEGKKSELSKKIGKKTLALLTREERLKGLSSVKVKLLIKFLVYRANVNRAEGKALSDWKRPSAFYTNVISFFLKEEAPLLSRAIQLCDDNSWKGLKWGVIGARKEKADKEKGEKGATPPVYDGNPNHIIPEKLYRT